MKKNGITILHIGRISYEKNVDVVLQAMKLISGYKKVKFMIVGGGPDLERLKNYSRKINPAEFTRSLNKSLTREEFLYQL